MNSDDSFNDSDEIFNLYSSKKVTETFKSNLKKIVSERFRSGGGEHSKGVFSNVNNFKERSNSPIEVIEDLRTIVNKKVRNTKDLEPAISESKELSSEDSLDVIEIIGEQSSTRRTRKSARLRRKRGEDVYDLDDSLILSPERAPRTRKKSSSLRKKNKNKKKRVVVEVNLDDSLEPSENIDEDELNPEVSVKVIWKSVGIKKFQIRKFQKMSKIFEELSREENIPEEKIFLTFNNIKVHRYDTPDSLNLQVYHFIDGGVLSELSNNCEKSSTSTLLNDSNSISLKFQGIANKIVKLVVNKDEKMKIGMIKYAEQLEVPLEKIKFFFDGDSLDASETPTSLGLEGDEIIDVKILL